MAIEHKIIAYLVNSNCSLVPLYSTVIFAFEYLPHTSPIPRLLVNTHCCHFDEEYDINSATSELKYLSDCPHDLMVRVMLRNSKIMNDPSCRKLKACVYYDHGSDADREGEM
jgi:hypothetical protein